MFENIFRKGGVVTLRLGNEKLAFVFFRRHIHSRESLLR